MIKEKIVLASQSPRRKELISLIADNVLIRPADCDETLPEGHCREITDDELKLISTK